MRRRTPPNKPKRGINSTPSQTATKQKKRSLYCLSVKWHSFLRIFCFLFSSVAAIGKKNLRSDTTGVGGTIKYRPFLNMSWSGLLDTMGAWGVSWCRLMSIAIANDIIGRPGRVHSRDYENVIQECKNARI
jgi:hypothetical protein